MQNRIIESNFLPFRYVLCTYVTLYNTVYIGNSDNVRIPVGTRINQLPEQEYIQIQNDLAIIAVDKCAEEYLCERKLFNYNEAPTNAVICEEQLPNLYRENIHKFGASSQWTHGEIVLSESGYNRSSRNE